MRFILDTACESYHKDEISHLKKLGFAFSKSIESNYPSIYVKGSKFPEIEINTLHELMAFVEEWGPIVVNEHSITIYDGYLE